MPPDERNDIHEIRADVSSLRANQANQEKQIEGIRDDLRWTVSELRAGFKEFGDSIVHALEKVKDQQDERDAENKRSMTRLYKHIDLKTRFNWQPLAAVISVFSIVVSVLVVLASTWIDKNDQALQSRLEQVEDNSRSERNAILQRFDERTSALREMTLIMQENTRKTMSVQFGLERRLTDEQIASLRRDIERLESSIPGS